MSGALLDRPQILPKKKSAGYIKGFSVSSFLQVIELERKSCNLVLRANGKKGCLFIRNGHIINAKTDAWHGEKAAIDILGWKNAQIKLSRPSKKIKQAIRSSLTRLILAAARRKKSET